MYDRIRVMTRGRREAAAAAWSAASASHVEAEQELVAAEARGDAAAATAARERVVATGSVVAEFARRRQELDTRLADLDAREAVLTAADAEEDAFALAADHDLADLLDLRARRANAHSVRHEEVLARTGLLAPLDALADELAALGDAIGAASPAVAGDVPAGLVAELEELTARASALRAQQAERRTDGPAPERIDPLVALLRASVGPLIAAREAAVADLQVAEEALQAHHTREDGGPAPAPFDPATEDTPAYEARVREWEERRVALLAIKEGHRSTVDELDVRAAALTSWTDRLAAVAETHRAVAAALAAPDAALATLDARIAELDVEISDHKQARTTATARLLGDVPAPQPLVLAPIRIETRWSGPVLQVRIFPDDFTVDSHDPRLTADEVASGRRYWESRDRDAAWTELTAWLPAPRAAWVTRSTAPGTNPQTRDTAMPAAPKIRLLPDRFAAMAFSDGAPIALGPDGRRTAWGARVTVTEAALEQSWHASVETPVDKMPRGPSSWLVEFREALAVGMALELELPAETPPIDLLVVVGLSDTDPRLGDLLAAHTFSSGCEVLADATPTNNSARLRSGWDRRRVEQMTAGLADPTATAEAGVAGAAVARVLGLDPPDLEVVPGAADGRGAGDVAARRLVDLVTEGALRGLLGPAGDATWPALAPTGPAPALRVGRQPYGLLPVTAPGRWVPDVGEVGLAAGDFLPAWASRAGLVVDGPVPAAELPPSSEPRLADPHDDDSWSAVLGESGWSLAWNDTATGTAVGAGPNGALDALSTRLLSAARRVVADTEADEIERALAELGTESSGTLGRVLSGFLDSVSHRLDPWISAVCTVRLQALRVAQPRASAYGAYGWTTDVAPRPGPRSHGRLLAPSLAQAATGAVLRSGFLAQRELEWIRRVAEAVRAIEQARASGDAVALAQAEGLHAAAMAGLTALSALEQLTEAALPLGLDLSGRRVRQALRVLAAVRTGQSTGAVLGYQFERDLAESGLQAHLSAFRSVSRLRTGTDLDERLRRRDEMAQAVRTIGTSLVPLKEAADRERGEAREHARLLAEAKATEAAAVAAHSGHPARAPRQGALEEAVREAQAHVDAVSRRLPHREREPIDRIRTEDEIRSDQTIREAENTAAWAAWNKEMRAAQQVLDRAQHALEAAVRGHEQERGRLDQKRQIAADLAGKAQVTWEVSDAEARSAEAARDALEISERDTIALLEEAVRAVGDALAAALATAGTAMTLGPTVDGLDLRARYRAATAQDPPRWDHSTIPFPITEDRPENRPEGLGLPVVGSPAYTAVTKVLRRLDDLVDAMADLVTAEGVHQLVAGNLERAGSAVEPSVSGQVPDVFDLVRSPRPARDVTRRVIVAWPAASLESWGTATPSIDALLDPSLNAWVGRRLPDPAGITVRVLGPTSARPAEFDLGELGLDALGWVRLAADPSELDRRLASVAAKRDVRGPIRLVEDDDPGRTTPADLLAAAAAASRLLDTARALRPDDLLPSGAPAAPVPDPTLPARLRAAENAVANVIDALDAVVAGASVDPEQALLRASTLGIAEATPGGSDGTDPRVRAAAASARLRSRLATLAPFEPDDTDPAETHRRALARAEALCGRRVPLLGPVAMSDAIRTAPADDDGGVRAWLIDRARVRPAVESLCALADLGEVLLDVEPLDATGLGLSPQVAEPLGLVVVHGSNPVPEQATGFLVDAWNEAVPAPEHTAGLAFHYERQTPDAPQALLIAVPPDTAATRWDLDTLVDTLLSTIALARERVVAAEHVPEAGLTVLETG